MRSGNAVPVQSQPGTFTSIHVLESHSNAAHYLWGGGASDPIRWSKLQMTFSSIRQIRFYVDVPTKIYLRDWQLFP